MDPTANIAQTVDNFNGGDPTRSDLVPAIVFLAVYWLTVVDFLALPILIWRAITRKHRCRELIGAGLWFITRTISLIMRAYMSRRSYGQKTLIAELILSSISPLFLINSLVDLWQRHMETKADSGFDDMHHGVNDNNKNTSVKPAKKNITWVKIVSAILKFILVVAFATAIAAGVLVGKDLNEESQRKTITNLLKASYIMTLAVTVISLLAKLATHRGDGRSLKKQMLVYAYSLPLLVLSIYRVVEVFSGYRAGSRALTAFYVAMILFEVIAYGILLAVSIPQWFRTARDHLTHVNSEKGHRLSDDRSTMNGQSVRTGNGLNGV